MLLMGITGLSTTEYIFLYFPATKYTNFVLHSAKKIAHISDEIIFLILPLPVFLVAHQVLFLEFYFSWFFFCLSNSTAMLPPNLLLKQKIFHLNIVSNSDLEKFNWIHSSLYLLDTLMFTIKIFLKMYYLKCLALTLRICRYVTKQIVSALLKNYIFLVISCCVAFHSFEWYKKNFSISFACCKIF